MKRRSESPRNRKTRARKSAGLLHSRLNGDPGRPPGRSPDHPGLPARISLLILPARGTVARLLEPREPSAVLARSGTIAVPYLRPDSGAGERCRPVMPRTTSRP
jgi:hypothetical protein